ncbi:hypothetical protein [Paenibacillus sp. SI8]|uniref:hypothetical protein n=1 Tax=unclassified Paenibacillus TaxID=185978 RepID=UPI003467919E
MTPINKRIVGGLLIIILFISLAYVVEWVDRENAIHSGKVISVMDHEGKLISLMGADVVRALLKQQFPDDAGAKGPTLLYVVGASGLIGYSEIEVKGLKGSQVFRIGRQELTDSLVLECNERGTVTLVQKSGPRLVLVDDVSEIKRIR